MLEGQRSERSESLSSLPSWLIPMAGFWSLQLLSKASSRAGYHTPPLVLRPQVLNLPTAAPPSPIALQILLPPLPMRSSLTSSQLDYLRGSHFWGPLP